MFSVSFCVDLFCVFPVYIYFLCSLFVARYHYVVCLSLDIIWSVSHFFTTVIQRLDDFVSRYFVCAKCSARRKYLAGLDHKPS